VSCDDADNDPVVLLSALAVAVNGIQPVDQAVFAALVSSGAGITFVPRFVSAIAGIDGRVVVVLDHVEAVTSNECRDVIAEFAVRLPLGWQLVLSSRIDPPLPTARLRAEGRLVEMVATDLAMDSREASALLKGAGVQAGAARVEELLQLTEGWAAGLYLAALATRAGAPESEVRSRFAGDDRFIGDYLRSELLDHLSDGEVSFMCRTSVLDRMCGPLCDAVLQRSGSGQFLEWMERRNLLVVALDRRREWYRYHYLLRELLETELLRREPDLVADLHLRAASWYEANAAAEAAIGHAQKAGDFDRAVRLVLDVAQPVWASGRVDTVLHWMQSLIDKSSAQHYVAIAAHGALIFALLGHAAEAERWATAAERAPTTGVPPPPPGPPRRGCFRTEARWRARWPICAPSCFEAASNRCVATRSWPGTD
jgi:LuxR family maltose regulon positive regulatory protein